MKRFLKVVAVALVGAMVFAACAPAALAEDGALKKLGLIHELQAWQMYQVMEQAIREKCEEMGVEFVVADGNEDVNKQLQFVETMLNSGVNGIIIVSLDGPTLEDAARRCTEQGVAFVSLFTEVETAGANMKVDEYMYGYGIGEIGAKYMAENFPDEEIEVALLRMHDYLPGIDRGRGMEDAVKEFLPKGKVVNDQHSVDVDSAMSATEAILAGNPNCRLFLTDSDDTGAIGCYEVLKAKVSPEDYHKYAVVGSDGVPQAFASIKEGGMYRGTVALDLPGIGLTAYQMASDFVNGREFEKVQYVPFGPVDITNVDEHIDE